MSGQDLPPRFFKPSCPSGGKFYACETGTRFVGCCQRQPCDSIGCTAGTLEPASFDGKFHSTFPDQQCSSGSWYTCNGTVPPFMGCCESNPCAKGCPMADLAAGFLDSNPLVAAPFLSTSVASVTSKTSSTSTSSSASLSTGITLSPIGATSSPTAGALPQPTTEPASRQISPGAIAGIVVGVIAFIAVLILIAIVLYFHRRNKAAAAAAAAMEPMRAEKDGEVGQSKPVAHSYTPHEIHEAPGVDVITRRDVKDPKHSGSPYQAYPSPSPAYSPGQHPSSRSPPAYPPPTELDTPPTSFLRHHDSNQSFELPVSSRRAYDVHGPVHPAVSTEGLGINFTARSHGSTIPT